MDVVSELNLRPIYDQYSGRGSKTVDPAVMVALLFYGYASGSSRKPDNATYENVRAWIFPSSSNYEKIVLKRFVIQRRN